MLLFFLCYYTLWCNILIYVVCGVLYHFAMCCCVLIDIILWWDVLYYVVFMFLCYVVLHGINLRCLILFNVFLCHLWCIDVILWFVLTFFILCCSILWGFVTNFSYHFVMCVLYVVLFCINVQVFAFVYAILCHFVINCIMLCCYVVFIVCF